MDTVQILKGPNGIKMAYEQALSTKTLDIVCLSGAYATVVGTFFDQDYALRLFRSQISTREILADTAENRADSVKKDKKKNQVRFVAKNIPSESDFMLFGNTAILVSYDLANPFAVVITDRQIASNFRIQFEALWEKAKT
jgi:hypothetical protein